MPTTTFECRVTGLESEPSEDLPDGWVEVMIRGRRPNPAYADLQEAKAFALQSLEAGTKLSAKQRRILSLVIDAQYAQLNIEPIEEIVEVMHVSPSGLGQLADLLDTASFDAVEVDEEGEYRYTDDGEDGEEEDGEEEEVDDADEDDDEEDEDDDE